MPQDPTIYNDLRIVDNVRYFASLYGMDASAADDCDRGGRADRITRTAYSGNLSGGQRTRASLACALVCHPDLLVLDEPTIGLDPVLRADLWEQFDALATLGIDADRVEPCDGRGRPLRRPAADARRPPVGPHDPEPTPRGHRMQRHWRKRFCPSSGAAPSAEPARAPGLRRQHRAHPASAGAPTVAASR